MRVGKAVDHTPTWATGGRESGLPCPKTFNRYVIDLSKSIRPGGHLPRVLFGTVLGSYGFGPAVVTEGRFGIVFVGKAATVACGEIHGPIFILLVVLQRVT